MKPMTVILGVLTAACLVLAAPPETPKTPAPVEDLVYARQFTVDQSFKHLWRKEQPVVNAGTLLVLKVNRALVVPREAQMPVLYVGDQTVQRLNSGHESGYLIVIVPATPDLTKTPIWFGTPSLPHRMDEAGVKAERAKADQAGIQPFSEEKVHEALARGGEPLKAANLSEILRAEAAELILKYSPQEKHIAEGFRVPVVTRRRPEASSGDGD
jgi:hypothetical protein